MTLSAKIYAQVAAAGGNPRQIAALNAAGVPRTPEFNRILALPRRPPPAWTIWRPDGPETPADVVTGHFRAPGGTWAMRPLQAATLIEAAEQNGAFVAMGVGEGKTLVGLLLPEVMQSTTAVLLLPPTMKAQLFRELQIYAQHFRLPMVLDADLTAQFPGDYIGKLYIVAYTELSSQKKGGILEYLNPDLVIADEAHNLRHSDAARTRRFVRFMRANPGVRFVPMSGTMTSGSVLDYNHLADLALGDGSPVPRSAYYRDCQAWAAALDPGAVSEEGALALLDRTPKGAYRVATARDNFHARLVETPGVIASHDSSVGASLVIRMRHPRVPKVVQDALMTLADTWAWDGMEYDDPMSIARIAKQMSCGYFLRWQWGTPDNQPTDAQRAWLDARNGLARAVRGVLKRYSAPGFDSPGLVVEALRAGGAGLAEWDAWLPHENTPEPAIDAVWMDDFLIKDAVAWAGVYKEGIIWSSEPCVGEAIAKALGVPYYGAGTDALLTQANATNTPILVASSRVHGTGKNLQDWCRNLIATPSADASTWQQLIGRTHRPGQLADEVECWVNVHTPAFAQAWETAREKAAYVQATMGDPQRILYATIIE